MTEFSDAWNLYPRKVCRKDAEKAWLKLTPEQKFAVIHALPVHARYWAMTGTAKEYMPHFSTWLNGERWTDEIELPEVRAADGEWWKTTAGITAKARQVGVEPRAGEDWHSLKSRIMEKERAA